MKQKDALEKLWSELDANPVPEDMSARKAKLASLMAKMPDAAGASIAAGASKPAAAGWSRTALRYAWVPLAAAACIAAVLLLRTPAQPAPGLVAEVAPAQPALELSSAPELLAEAAIAPTVSEAVCKTAPECTWDTEKPASHVQNDPNSHMATAESAHATAEAAPTEPAPAAPAPDPVAEVPAPQRRRRTITLGLFAAGNPGSASNANVIGYSKIAVYPDASLGSIFTQYSASKPVESATTPVIIGTTPKVQMHHDMPLNIGVSLAFSITKRLALESGITYSYLHSSVSEPGNDYDRHLHYLGVPLALQYKVLDRPKFSAYVSGGGSVAYCLGGKLVKPGVITVAINDHPVQTALTASAGAEYRLAGPFSIFGEVAFNRFFNDGTGLETYYSQNPYAPSFKAGARITINK